MVENSSWLSHNVYLAYIIMNAYHIMCIMYVLRSSLDDLDGLYVNDTYIIDDALVIW